MNLNELQGKMPLIESRLLDLDQAMIDLSQRSAEDATPPVLTGRAAVFGVLSQPMTLLLDNGEKAMFRERIDPGFFTGADMSDVICCIDHDLKRLLGRTPLTLTLTVDREALLFRCQLPPLPIADEIAVYVGRRDIRGCSFSWLGAEDRWERLADGTIIRHLLKCRELRDVGPVVRPAYVQTDVAQRSYNEFVTSSGLILPGHLGEKRERTLRANERALSLLNL